MATDGGIWVAAGGLSRELHGNPETAQKDRAIREQLRAHGYEVLEIAASELTDRTKMARHFYRLARWLLDRPAAQRMRDEPTWFDEAEGSARADVRPSTSSAGAEKVVPFERVEPTPDERYRTAIPLYSLKVAAGGFGESQEVEPEAWVRPSTRRRLDSEMFVAQVVGRSMEPTIPDEAYCIFRKYGGGSRTGKIVLAQHREISDPETGGSYTVKIFDSSGVRGKDGEERAGTILLRPRNPDYEPIELNDIDEPEEVVIAELVEVLPGDG